MKVKEQIELWRDEVKKLKEATDKVSESNKILSKDIADLKTQVNKLLDLTENMTEAMLALIRQQIGD